MASDFCLFEIAYLFIFCSLTKGLKNGFFVLIDRIETMRASDIEKFSSMPDMGRVLIFW